MINKKALFSTQALVMSLPSTVKKEEFFKVFKAKDW